MELALVAEVMSRMDFLDKVDWASWVEQRFNLPLLPKLPTPFPRLSHHIYLHLHKSSTVPVLLAFSITTVSSQLWTADTTRQWTRSTVFKCQWQVSHWPSTVRGELLVCRLVWIHCVSCTVTVWYTVCTKCKNYHIFKQKKLPKLLYNANPIHCCSLNWSQ